MKPNVTAEFDQAIKQMEWDEVLDTLQAAVEDVLGVTPNAPPLTPALPSQLGYDFHLQPVDQMHEAYQQAGFHSQGQQTLYPSPVGYCPAAYLPSINNVPETSCCESPDQTCVPLQLFKGELVYTYTVHHPESSAPSAPTSMLKKRKYNKQQEGDQPYVKKPLNAFMLFMKEQRQSVVAEIKNKNNATVNRILGQRWASLSTLEKQRFYQKAEEEKLLHAKQNPGWSSSDNYGQKRKRQRRKAQTAVEPSAPELSDIQKETEQTAVVEAAASQRDVMMPYVQDVDFQLVSMDNFSFLELLQSA